jgi:hypothetical protein
MILFWATIVWMFILIGLMLYNCWLSDQIEDYVPDHKVYKPPVRIPNFQYHEHTTE